jgi:hypothetical protein
VLKLQSPLGLTALHLLAILAVLVTLFVAAPIKPLFVLLAAIAAFFAAALTRYGQALRTLGSWAFIPGCTSLANCTRAFPQDRAFDK